MLVIITIFISFISFLLGYFIKHKKMYFLIAGYSHLKNKTNSSKEQMSYANRIANSCFFFGGAFIILRTINYFSPLFPIHPINLDFFYIIIISLFFALLFPFFIKNKAK